MSGGSLDYVYGRVNDAANEIRRGCGGSALHLAFAVRLDAIAKALHDIEWVMSGDYGDGDDVAAIKAALGNWPSAELVEIRKQVDAIGKRLDDIEGKP